MGLSTCPNFIGTEILFGICNYNTPIFYIEVIGGEELVKVDEQMINVESVDSLILEAGPGSDLGKGTGEVQVLDEDIAGHRIQSMWNQLFSTCECRRFVILAEQ